MWDLFLNTKKKTLQAVRTGTVNSTFMRHMTLIPPKMQVCIFVTAKKSLFPLEIKHLKRLLGKIHTQNLAGMKSFVSKDPKALTGLSTSEPWHKLYERGQIDYDNSI